MKICNYEIKVKGIVQGVGFRPFIYSIAKSLYLNGTVKNACGGVVIEVEGALKDINTFIELIKKDAPPLSYIRGIDVNRGKYKGYAGFTIERSEENSEQNIYISPDVAVCKECEKELFNKNDRRYLYPFINCTNCGPRFTIVTGNPYDRVNTTMSGFTMCSGCASEYKEPVDRRYHAQPVSCFNCGPGLQLPDRNGDGVDADADGIVKLTAELLEKGHIIAIKGLGGYHLVCSALDKLTVQKLRKRKVRDDKPFALMVKDHDTALKYCHINEQEKRLLESWKRPVVLLEKKTECMLPDEIAPGNPCLGIMLPYTPLHLLLFRYLAVDTLVVTSGNISSEPIFYKNEEAIKGLNGIADFFLVNDRDIFIRTDDSVTRVFRGREYIIRRSRGYVPIPITCGAVNINNSRIPSSRIPSVLACGGELKNTFCMNKGDEFYLSQHIGDLENFETLTSFEEGIEHFRNMFKIKLDMVAYDLHPEYLSTKYAIEQNINEKSAIQHHHAHIASCMAENGLDGDIIGVAFDGTGYGEDGHLWGGEFFTGSYSNFNRIGHLDYVKMPGGEMAIKEPWRMAVSYLQMMDADITEISSVKYLTDIEAGKIDMILKMLDKNLNCPLTSSMGRLFDAVSALLGVRSRINYEGQAAIELEYIADRSYNCECGCYNYGCKSSYKYDLSVNNGGAAFIIRTGDIIKGIVADIKNGLPEGIISAKFHETAANIVLGGCEAARKMTGIAKVALSGGVFQNMLLLEKCVSKLEDADFTVYTHSKVPANDGGISLGQAVIAIARLMKG